MKNKYLITVFVILGIITTAIFWSISKYNSLVRLNEKVKSQWGQVENSYQRRLDLIPNLVNTVRGSINFEKRTLIEVIQARAKATSIIVNSNNLSQNQINKFQSAQEGLNSSLNRLLVSIERYPELKAIQNFTELQSQIEGTENRINLERNRFNEEVKIFNSSRNSFPNIFIANFFLQFSEKGYFKSQEGAEKAPIINFVE